MESAIVFKDLEWRYEHRKSFALKGINLEIKKNDFVGIVGANEHGKTTLVSAISGLVPHSYNGIYKGSVEVFGEKVFDSDALQLATNVGIVFSDPEAQFTAMTVEEELAFGLENMGFDIDKIKERIDWAAEITLIQDLLDRANGLHEKVCDQEFDPVQALELGSELEKDFCQAHIGNSVEFRDESLKKMFAALAQDDKIHSQKLLDAKKHFF